MLRNLLLPTLLLSALVGCAGGEGHYHDIHVSLDSLDLVTVFIKGKDHGTGRAPCPPALYGAARVNGIAMKQRDVGGADDEVDTDDETCNALSFELDSKLLPADTETLDITFDLHESGGLEYEDARAWHVTVAFTPEHVWTEDDLAARMQAREEFEVHWTPPSPVPPEVQLSVSVSNRDRNQATVTLVSSEPGLARYRFDGPEPSVLWSVAATRKGELEPTRCSGFKRCHVDEWSYSDLQPGGIPPATPAGVAPPRPCIALPGANGSRYRSPEWSGFPNLSELQLGRRTSCDSADLYFVVLGACGVCGGGKSTYVVGNRGTEPASFSVRSNVETIDGAVLEPQQLSEPFEISFEGLSELEIISDEDCDPASNVAWVENIVCEADEQEVLLWRIGARFEMPDWKPDGCNNTCGIP